ncbi:MAG: PQQ-dependent sugar dehydrogenase [Pyrinomonadaceae bacterium]
MKNIAVAALLVLFFFHLANAQLPFRLRQNVFSGLSLPVFLTNAGDGTRRIFIVQQRGIIKVAQPGSSVLTDYLNISGIVSNSGNERGLLGLAFHPQFAANRRFFVYYTRQSDGAIEIAEYEQSPSNPNVANPNAVRTIITIPHPNFTNHNGGTIAFGPDGYLYAGTGDGGSANDPPANAQNINVLLGKMIRIDIDTPPGQIPAYNIPPTNPYAGSTPGADEIYAIGLRNPYRFSFDRGGSRQLWVGDVGQNTIEEVDIITLGGNYGWRVYEGSLCTGLDPNLCAGGTNPIQAIPPVFEYNRVGTPRCSVTGGYVYRGRQNALLPGTYVYGDYCSGEIIAWNGSQQVVQLDTTRNISSFGEDEDGEIYVVGLGGTVDKIVGKRTNSDFDGDGGSDYAVFRPSTGVWYAGNPITGNVQIAGFGTTGDIPTADDFDGDGKTDFAVFRPSNGFWYFIRSSDATVGIIKWGIDGDVPSPGDFDGDRKADLTVFRPSTGVWYSILSSNGAASIFQFGVSGDIPVNTDYDGDGRDDVAVWRPSTGVWWRINSSNGALSVVQFGLPDDIPTPGDYDGDGRVDEAVFRQSSGLWFIRKSSDTSLAVIPWGTAGDIPVFGDYDRDYRDDVAIFRPSTGVWWVLRSSDGSVQLAQFGLSGDIPVPSGDRP